MPSPDWESAAHRRWDTTLHGLRATALDCLQTTLALLADHAHGTGTHIALGCRWRFPTRTASGDLLVQVPLRQRLADAAELLGLRVGVPQHSLDGPAVRHQLADVGRLYVVADAFDLPWLPFAGHRHMLHSFLLEDTGQGYVVVDAYHNDTEWGQARPGVWVLSAQLLDQVLTEGALVVTVQPTVERPEIDKAAVLAANAARARAVAPDIEGYASAVRARLGQPEVVEGLVLDIWLLGRERLLHAEWLADDPAAAQVVAQAQTWQRLSMQAYLAMRRLQRGGPQNGALIDDMTHLLHSDAALAAQLEPPSAMNNRDVVVTTVLDALRRTLDVDNSVIHRAGTLRALPGFNSFRLVDVIDRIERSLGVQLPGDLAADDLRDVAGLCRLFTGAMRWQGTTAGTRS